MRTNLELASVALGFALAVALGCGGAEPHVVHMSTNEAIPAAQGTIQASVTENNNTVLEVELRHLAPPGKVRPGATVYVVWARARDQDRPQNLGALMVDANLRGSLTTITPLRDFDVFITAERYATVSRPSSEKQLFSAAVQR